jgi:hypothetical protein
MSSDRLPPASVLLRACKLSIDEDKPVYYDYYHDSLDKKCCIGVKEEDSSKFLIRSDNEYTSNIQTVFKSENCYIVMTENSIYVVSNEIPINKILSTTKKSE